MPNLPMILRLADELDQLALDPYPFYRAGSYRWPPSFVNRLLSDETLTNKRQLLGDILGPVSNVGKDGFQVCMDVAAFKPSELSVKVSDGSVIVEGKHEERQDRQGYISRHFVRRYALPKDYDSEKVMSTLSSDGVLTVSVPKPQTKDESNEKIIQIQQTGPAHLNVKENIQEESEKSKKK